MVSEFSHAGQPRESGSSSRWPGAARRTARDGTQDRVVLVGDGEPSKPAELQSTVLVPMSNGSSCNKCHPRWAGERGRKKLTMEKTDALSSVTASFYLLVKVSARERVLGALARAIAPRLGARACPVVHHAGHDIGLSDVVD